MSTIEILALASITIDDDIQQRTSINDSLVTEYSETIADWQSTAPATVFFDGDNHWLADGFHRYHAATKAGLDALFVIIQTGDKRDAIRHSLGANATHGLRRSESDLARAYQTAVTFNLCGATDSKGVAALLGCSDRHARALTFEARSVEKDKKITEIQRLADDGMHQRDIADRMGVSVGTVNSTLVQKRNSAKTEHAVEIDKLTIAAPADRPELLALAQWQRAGIDRLDAEGMLNGKAGVLEYIRLWIEKESPSIDTGAILLTAQPTATNGAA